MSNEDRRWNEALDAQLDADRAYAWLANYFEKVRLGSVYTQPGTAEGLAQLREDARHNRDLIPSTFTPPETERASRRAGIQLG